MPNTFRIGHLNVLVVSDGYAKFPATAYYRGTAAEHWEQQKRWFDREGNLGDAEWSGLSEVDRKPAGRAQEIVAREIEESGALLATAPSRASPSVRVLRGEGRR